MDPVNAVSIDMLIKIAIIPARLFLYLKFLVSFLLGHLLAEVLSVNKYLKIAKQSEESKINN